MKAASGQNASFRLSLTMLMGMGFPRYTTFSTFSLDAYYLVERGQTLASFAYMIASVALSVGALIAALRLIRALP
jgi:fluoride ion exporter CrcB/FEX